jgi:predicted nucleic acid-binding protein
VIAADTSAAIAAFASWHEAHAAATAALPADAALVAHCALETYSVLTRLPVPHRAPAPLVAEFLAARFPAPQLVLSARAQRELVPRLLDLGIRGGAVYDALVALTATEAGATLVSCDRRAEPIYRRCGAAIELVT